MPIFSRKSSYAAQVEEINNSWRSIFSSENWTGKSEPGSSESDIRKKEIDSLKQEEGLLEKTFNVDPTELQKTREFRRWSRWNEHYEVAVEGAWHDLRYPEFKDDIPSELENCEDPRVLKEKRFEQLRKHLEKEILSPFHHQKYLKKLVRRIETDPYFKELARKHETDPSVPAVSPDPFLEECAYVRRLLTDDCDMATRYFCREVFNCMIEAAKGQVSPDKVSKLLTYYKHLIDDTLFKDVSEVVERFLEKYEACFEDDSIFVEVPDQLFYDLVAGVNDAFEQFFDAETIDEDEEEDDQTSEEKNNFYAASYAWVRDLLKETASSLIDSKGGPKSCATYLEDMKNMRFEFIKKANAVVNTAADTMEHYANQTKHYAGQAKHYTGEGLEYARQGWKYAGQGLNYVGQGLEYAKQHPKAVATATAGAVAMPIFWYLTASKGDGSSVANFQGANGTFSTASSGAGWSSDYNREYGDVDEFDEEGEEIDGDDGYGYGEYRGRGFNRLGRFDEFGRFNEFGKESGFASGTGLDLLTRMAFASFTYRASHEMGASPLVKVSASLFSGLWGLPGVGGQESTSFFIKTIGGVGDESGFSIRADVNGCVVAGESNSFGVNDDILFAQFALNGSLEWIKNWGGGGSSDRMGSVLFTQAGNILLTGRYYPGNPYMFVSEFDRNGNVNWFKKTEPFSLRGTRGRFMQPTMGGGYVVMGDGLSDLLLMKIDEGGGTTWARTISVVNFQQVNGRSIQQTSDDGYIITGFLYGVIGSSDFVIIKVDTNGNLEWGNVLGRGGTDKSYAAYLTDGNGVIVAGETTAFGGAQYNILLSKFNVTTGEEVSTKTLRVSSYNRAYSVALTNTGGFVLAGCVSYDGEVSYVPILVAFNATEHVEWAKEYSGFEDACFNSVYQAFDNSFFLTGYGKEAGANNTDLLVMHLDDNGEIPGCNTTQEITPVITPVTPTIVSITQNITSEFTNTTLEPDSISVLPAPASLRTHCNFSSTLILPTMRTTTDLSTSFFQSTITFFTSRSSSVFSSQASSSSTLRSFSTFSSQASSSSTLRSSSVFSSQASSSSTLRSFSTFSSQADSSSTLRSFSIFSSQANSSSTLRSFSTFSSQADSSSGSRFSQLLVGVLIAVIVSLVICVAIGLYWFNRKRHQGDKNSADLPKASGKNKASIELRSPTNREGASLRKGVYTTKQKDSTLFGKNGARSQSQQSGNSDNYQNLSGEKDPNYQNISEENFDLNYQNVPEGTFDPNYQNKFPEGTFDSNYQNAPERQDPNYQNAPVQEDPNYQNAPVGEEPNYQNAPPPEGTFDPNYQNFSH